MLTLTFLELSVNIIVFLNIGILNRIMDNIFFHHPYPGGGRFSADGKDDKNNEKR